MNAFFSWLRRAALPLAAGLPLLLPAQSFSGAAALLEAWKRDPDLIHASWGFVLMDARTGEIRLSQDPDRSLATASTMKVITTVSALSLLGAEQRFETRVEHDGKIEEGVLKGNLYIRGGGDPALGSERFGEEMGPAALAADWVARLRAAGIRQIEGRVLADDLAWGSQSLPGDWAWDDIGNYYGAGVSSLNFMENQYRLIMRPGARAGERAEILRTEPLMKDLTFVNELSTGAPGSGDNAFIYGGPYTYLKYVRGSIPAGYSTFTIKGALPDPALYCAQFLTEQLEAAGIPVAGAAGSLRIEQALNQLPNGRRSLLFSHLSPPLKDIVFHTNQKSVNLFAEVLAFHCAIRQGHPPLLSEVPEALTAFWQAQGMNTGGLLLRDGSGLSAGNSATAAQLAQVLRQAYQMPFFEVFKSSLPEAGRSGSLAGMMRGTLAEGRIFAKSGYIAGVRGYAGYVFPQAGGGPWVFAVLVNRYGCSTREMGRKLEQLMISLASGR